MSNLHLMLVDDDPVLRECWRELCAPLGYDLSDWASSEEAGQEMLQRPPDILLVDLVLPGQSGLELIAQARSLDPTMASVILTGHGSLDTAIQAMQEGVVDYLQKPLRMEQLEMALLRARSKVLYQRENQSLRNHLEWIKLYQFLPLLPDLSGLLRQAVQSALVLAPSDWAALLGGGGRIPQPWLEAGQSLDQGEFTREDWDLAREVRGPLVGGMGPCFNLVTEDTPFLVGRSVLCPLSSPESGREPGWIGLHSSHPRKFDLKEITTLASLLSIALRHGQSMRTSW